MKGVRCPLSVLCRGTNLILPFGSCVFVAWMCEGFSLERQLEAAPKDEPLGVQANPGWLRRNLIFPYELANNTQCAKPSDNRSDYIV